MKPIDIAIENALILTCNASHTVFSDATLLIKGNRIEQIAPHDKLNGSYRAEKVLSGKGKLLMPGLVNTHTHAAMTIFRGFAEDMPLSHWLNEYVFPYEKKYITPQTVQAGTELALIEMIASGTTTFSDMYFFEDRVAEAAKNMGIRALVGEGILDFPTPSCATPDEALQKTEWLAKKYHNDEFVRVCVAPHAPYTCSPQLLQKSQKLAKSLNLPLHIHLAETKDELESFLQKKQMTPTAFLNTLGLLNEKIIAAHCIHLTSDDISLMKKHKAGVAHNPECNMKLASGAAPIPELNAAGVKIGLGTDGAASNNNLDLFQEARTAALLHKLSANNPAVAKAQNMVECMTIGGARVLGMEKEIGSLEEGKKADVILVDLQKPHLIPLWDIYAQILYSMTGQDVETVITDGKIRMLNGKILSANTKKIMKTVQQIADEIKQKEYR